MTQLKFHGERAGAAAAVVPALNDLELSGRTTGGRFASVETCLHTADPGHVRLTIDNGSALDAMEEWSLWSGYEWQGLLALTNFHQMRRIRTSALHRRLGGAGGRPSPSAPCCVSSGAPSARRRNRRG